MIRIKRPKTALLLTIFAVVITLLMSTNAVATDFNITSYTPYLLNITLTNPDIYSFTASISDPDNDTNCSWLLEDNELVTGTDFVFRTAGIPQANDYNLTLECVDNETTKTVQWNVNIQESQYSNVYKFVIWILCFVAAYMFFYKKGEKILAGIVWLMLSVLSAFFTDTVISLALTVIFFIVIVHEWTKGISNITK